MSQENPLRNSAAPEEISKIGIAAVAKELKPELERASVPEIISAPEMLPPTEERRDFHRSLNPAIIPSSIR